MRRRESGVSASSPDASRQAYHAWTIPQAVQRGWQVFHEEGLWSLWIKVLGETVYRRILLLERLLAEPVSKEPSRLPVTVRRLEEEQIGAYAAFQPASDLSDIRRRLKEGHQCYAAWHENRIIRVLWITTGSARIKYLGCRIRLASDEAYLYDSFTRPEYRGQNIPAAMPRHYVPKLLADGIRRMVADILPENQPGLRHAVKNGWKPIGLIGYFKLGPYRHDFCRMYGDSPPPGETVRVSDKTDGD